MALWLVLVCGMILVATGLPLPARIVSCFTIATPGIAVIRRVFLLEGRGSIRALAWSSSDPHFMVRLQGLGRETPAVLARGSFRLGAGHLLLWLRACDRLHAVFIDGYHQDGRAFRGLCRRLRWPPRVP